MFCVVCKLYKCCNYAIITHIYILLLYTTTKKLIKTKKCSIFFLNLPNSICYCWRLQHILRWLLSLNISLILPAIWTKRHQITRVFCTTMFDKWKGVIRITQKEVACILSVTFGLNFTSFLLTAFTLADPKCAKKDSQVVSVVWDLMVQKLFIERWWNWHLVSISPTFYAQKCKKYS